jgi:hypothetical protein
MSCKSPSIERVVQRSDKAKNQLIELENQISELEDVHKENFEKKIGEFAKKSNINDFRQLIYSSAVKTEYSHEFSLDKIAPIIAAALEAVASSLTGSAVEVLTSPNAIKSYSDLVLTITEAAKSKSSASNSLSFNANRIAPGVHAFLTANSVSIKDDETFGEESVTATSVMYSLNNSIQDLQQTVDWELAYLDSENLIKLKRIQVGYTDDLAEGKITLAVWFEKNKQIELAITALKQRLDTARFYDIAANARVASVLVNESSFEIGESRQLLEKAVLKFEERGSLYTSALEKGKLMLNNPFF